MFISLKAFDAFYMENKNKIYMKKKVNYPLNYKKAQAWADAHCDKESREFAYQIIENTLYVPFYTFLLSVQEIAQNYVLGMQDDNRIRVLIIPGSLSKSNTWVSLLAYPVIKAHITHISDDITGVYLATLDKSSELYNKHIDFIVFDDCAYTGSQLYESLKFDPFRINDKEHTIYEPEHTSIAWLEWRKQTLRNSEAFISKITSVKIHVLVPFMSTNAHNFITTKIPHVVVSPISVIVQMFSTRVDISKIKPAILAEFSVNFQYHQDINAIYFDHKVADGVSTFNKIYMLAPVFNCVADSMPSYKFIDNCHEVADSNYMSQPADRRAAPDIYNYIMDVEKKYGRSNKVCPRTFYKQIEFRHAGKKIHPSLSIFDLK